MSSRWQRVISVWRRNSTVWCKTSARSLLGSFSDPVLYLLAFGYGLGRLVGEVNGMTYVAFLSSGIIATNAMNTATFEGLYLAYTRMETQRTWESILSAPLSVSDIVFGEILWIGTKSAISVTMILLVVSILGLVNSWAATLVIPIGFIGGICFGSMALVVTSYSSSYEFFLYYMTLFITPMVLLSGVFFPLSSLPYNVQIATAFLPLQHLVQVIRPLIFGQFHISDVAHLTVPVGFFLISTAFAVRRFKLRLLH